MSDNEIENKVVEFFSAINVDTLGHDFGNFYRIGKSQNSLKKTIGGIVNQREFKKALYNKSRTICKISN